MHIRSDVFEAKEQSPTREGFGWGLVEAADRDPRVVALCADLTDSTRVEPFRQKYPERFIEVGVAEQNLAALGAGFAEAGKIPFITSYAAFNPGRNYEQIRTTACLNEMPVKIGGMHSGVSVGPDGATHQALEDMALMRVVPRMTVIYPCDAEEAKKATIAAVQTNLPVYLRFAREKTPLMTTHESPFEIGKANVLWRGENARAVIFAAGPLVHNSLLAARELASQGINVVVTNVHTIKPLDRETIVGLAKEIGAAVTVEEHQIVGGLGSAIAELLVQEHPIPIEFIGVRDQFGQSGKPDELIAHYGLDSVHIVQSVMKVVERRG